MLFLAACICYGAGSGFFRGKDNPRHSIKAALILPLNASSDHPDVNFMDFYAGAVLAAGDLKESGMDISLKVIDYSSLDDDDSPLDDELLKCDFIIGPVSRGDQRQILSICRAWDIPFVSPMDQASADYLGGNPFFFQIPASPATQISNLVESVADGPEGRITVFYDQSPESLSMLDAICRQLDERSMSYDKITYEVLRGRDITGRLRSRMAAGGVPNKVILASDNVAFASDVIRNMALLVRSGVQVSVYGPSRIRNFDTIDIESLYLVNFHTSTPYFVDYRDEAVVDFILKYRNMCNAEPTPYSFQGYDMLTYFATVASELGSTFREYVEYYAMDLLQNSIRFKRLVDQGEDDGGAGGCYNTATRNIEYRPDYTIVLK